VAIAYHGGNTRNRSQFLRRALGVAAGDNDPRRGILAVGAANEGARGPVGLGGHAAGIHDDDIRNGRLLLGKACSAQPVAHRFAIGASGTATEVFHEEARHSFSLEPFPVVLNLTLAASLGD
jgi:hypothetical protein